MSKNIIVTAWIAVAAITTASAFAADGQVNFGGKVIDTACNVSNLDASKMLTVEMGSISRASFTAKGSKSNGVNFTLSVSDCPDTTDGGVRVSFDGESVSDDNSILDLDPVEGKALGVGIQLTDASQNVLPLYTQSTMYPLTNGNGTLEFIARYIATQDDVKTGVANATANFTIIYN
ncbi:ferrous iron transporter B [Serratia sp. S1B]|nr:ferrous iron transporter B [Serratia sp. S1B]